MGNLRMNADQISYKGGNTPMTVEEALKNSSGEAAVIEQLQQDVSDLNGNKANKADIATEFSNLTNYNVGDLVYYDGALYEFQVDHTAGDWETSEVIQKDLSDIINSKGSGLPDYSTTEQDTGLAWIDGKTVYEKTCPVTLHGNSDSDTLLVSDTSISNAWIVNSDFILSAGGEDIHFYLGANVNGVWTTGFLIKKSDGLYLRSKNAYAAADGVSGYVTIRYVKTTA